jgi:hypothetical protein
MAINARTFQILYIIRERAVADLATTAKHVSAFIMGRRKDAPGIYGRAYIAPGAVQQILNRMTTGEGLLTLEDDEYLFTAKGSLMADLLAELDACSDRFIDNYKELVSLAVLQQRQRLAQGAANPREVATIANISLDSARRGLSDLADKGTVIEDRTHRTPTYKLPVVVVPVGPSDPAVVAAAFGAPNVSGIGKGTDAFSDPSGIDKADPVADALAGIDDDDEGWATTGDAPPDQPDDEDLLPLALGKILQDDKDDAPKVAFSTDPDAAKAARQASTSEGFREQYGTEQPEVEKVTDPYDWNSVTVEVQASHIASARACGMTLSGYFGALNHRHEEKIRLALFNTHRPNDGDGSGIAKHQAMIAAKQAAEA